MTYQYTYLILGLIFLVVWLILFLWRKDTRKEMLIMSLIFGFAGPLADILYTQDWWNPQTLTDTKIGLEAILVGFMIGGIASVIYESIFKKRIWRRRDGKSREFSLFFPLILAVILFFGTFYFLNFNSLLSTIVALVIPTLIIWIKRKDLIIDSLITGFLLVIVSILVYTAVEILTPGWVDSFWIFKNVPDIIVLNVPIDDIIWYFLAGGFIGPLYEFWQEGRLRKISK
jgi:hypothetical protein